MGTTDCQHLATAILYEADEFHTLDGSGKRKKGTILQTITGKVANKYPLHILVPRSIPGPLFEIKDTGSETSSQKLIAPTKVAVSKNIGILEAPTTNLDASSDPEVRNQPKSLAS